MDNIIVEANNLYFKMQLKSMGGIVLNMKYCFQIYQRKKLNYLNKN